MHPHRSHWITALAVLFAVGLAEAPVFADGVAHVRTLGELSRKMARPAGFEPATPGLEVPCSIQLSYGRTVFVCR